MIAKDNKINDNTAAKGGNYYPNKPIVISNIESYSILLVGGSSSNLNKSCDTFLSTGCKCAYYTYSGSAIEYMLKRPVDLVVLSSGFTAMLHKIRRFSSVPILGILSNNAFDIGGCDLTLRTNKDNYDIDACKKILFLLQQMRMSFEFSGSTLCQNVYINMDSFEALINDTPVSLKPMEMKILFYLMKNKNRVINRRAFIKSVWDNDQISSSRTVDVHLKDLRSKLNEHGAKFTIISLRNVGVQLLENDIKNKID